MSLVQVEFMEAVSKSVITTGTMGDSVLLPERMNEIIHNIKKQTVLLRNSRLVIMTSNVKNIDFGGFGGDVLHYGKTFATDGSDGSTPTHKTNQLIAQVVEATFSIPDADMRRNMLRNDYLDWLITDMSGAIGQNLARLQIYGNRDGNITDALTAHQYLGATGGIIEKAGAGKILFKDGFTDATDEEEVMGAAIDTFSPELLTGKELFFVPFSVFRSYTKTLKALGENYRMERIDRLGDRPVLSYEGYYVVHDPALDSPVAVASSGTGKAVVFVDPSNLLWGVFQEMRFKAGQPTLAFRTDVLFEIDTDFQYLREDAVVIALIELVEPV